MAAAGLDAHISIKPTQLGLDLDRGLCERNMDRLVERAEQLGNFVWIDMEGSPYVDPTIEIFKRSRAKSARVGIAIQAYLFRTPKDIEAMIPLGPAIRIVKGAYLEPPDIAYPKKADVDEAFYQAVHAAHGRRRAEDRDAAAHRDARHPARRSADLPTSSSTTSRSRPTSSRCSTASSASSSCAWRKEGQRLRVLISYGEYWFPWYMRRLAERPANVWFVIRTMFG